MINNLSTDPLIPFIATIVDFSEQKEQVSGLGWGWKYKLAIQADYTNNKTDIPLKEMNYGIVLLPTTAATGAAGRRNSVMLCQGDKVFGVKFGGRNGVPIILGSFPRTSETKYGPNPHDCKSGYVGDLKKTSLLIEESNEQSKGDTPQCSKGGHTKSNRTFR